MQIYLSLCEREDTKTQRWEWSYPRLHCTNYHDKSHSWVLWGTAEENVAQHPVLDYHHGTVFQVHPVITKYSCYLWHAEQTEAGPNWLLVLQTLKSLQKEKLEMSLAEDTPGYCEDITNWGRCILWLFFLTLGSHARKQLVGKQRRKE